jgi:hypothetical protein
MIFRKVMLTWLLIIAFGLAMLRLESVVFGQYVNPAKAEDYESMHDYLKPRAQVIETLPWSEVTSNDFNHPAGEDIADHLRNHPMLGNELEKLHEWLHQKVERTRLSSSKQLNQTSQTGQIVAISKQRAVGR